MTSSTSWGASFGSAGLGAMQVYDDVLVPTLFTPWARRLLDELDLEAGEAVLDVACGPGSVTRLAAVAVGPRGRVTHRTLPHIVDADPSRFTSTLAASGIAADLKDASPEVWTRLAEAFGRNVSELVVDGSIQSEAASHLAFAVR